MRVFFWPPNTGFSIHWGYIVWWLSNLLFSQPFYITIPRVARFHSWCNNEQLSYRLTASYSQRGSCKRLSHWKVARKPSTASARGKKDGQGCGCRASSGGSLEWKLKPWDHQLIVYSGVDPKAPQAPSWFTVVMYLLLLNGEPNAVGAQRRTLGETDLYL